MASKIVDGILRWRFPTRDLRPGDVITVDPYAAASEKQAAFLVVRGPRSGWITVQPVARDLDLSPSWQQTGPERATRTPRTGVFVIPAETHSRRH